MQGNSFRSPFYFSICHEDEMTGWFVGSAFYPSLFVQICHFQWTSTQRPRGLSTLRRWSFTIFFLFRIVYLINSVTWKLKSVQLIYSCHNIWQYQPSTRGGYKFKYAFLNHEAFLLTTRAVPISSRVSCWQINYYLHALLNSPPPLISNTLGWSLDMYQWPPFTQPSNK